MDIVYITDLRVETVIGIYDWERKIKQIVAFDVEMAADISQSASSDHIDDTINYKAVAKHIIAFAQASEFQLVETLAHKTAERVMQEFSIPWLRLRLSKPGAVRGAKDVGVIIERGIKPACPAAHG